MHKKFIRSICSLCCTLVLPGVLLPIFTSSGISLYSEAVFAEALTLPDLSLFSALPLALKKPVVSSPVPTPSPSAGPETTSPSIYTHEPVTDGETLLIKNSTDYAVDTEELLSRPFPLGEGEPKVLIVHTHTSEAYTQSKDYTYTPSDAYRTEDPEDNICLVGKALANSLEKNGISCVHDTTSHDYPSYSGCYSRSLETIEKNLALCPTIEVVIDLHRDALAAPDGSYMKTAAQVNGKTMAQALVVVGTDAGGLTHPDWEKNLSLGLRLQKNLCEMYPGLARPLHLRTERFNGHASPGALLIEIGSNGNTMEEALDTAELVGNALAKTLLPLLP